MKKKNENPKIIKSTSHILKFANDGKLMELDALFDDAFVVKKNDLRMILSGKLPHKTNLNSWELPDICNIYHSQWKQIMYKESSYLVSSLKSNRRNMRWERFKVVYAYFKDNGRQVKFTSKRFSELNLNPIKVDEEDINIDHLSSIVIDDRLFNIQETPGGEFDAFIHLRLPYFEDDKKRAKTINLPIKYHSHYLKYANDPAYKRKNSIQLYRSKIGVFYVKFIFEKDMPAKKTEGEIKGVDVGVKRPIVTNDGQILGLTLEPIYNSLCKKTKDSKAYKKKLTHRTNELNRICKDLDLTNTKELRLENLKGLKIGKKGKKSKKMNRLFSYWLYSKIKSNICNICNEQGVEVVEVPPEYTSQTCSKCGLTHKNSRRGVEFVCVRCGNIMDADINAAINISRGGAYNPFFTKNV